jgi:hypothetical protein
MHFRLESATYKNVHLFKKSYIKITDTHQNYLITVKIIIFFTLLKLNFSIKPLKNNTISHPIKIVNT